MAEPSLTNQLLARMVIGELLAVGCRQVVLSPGARSAPLALAVAACDQLHRTIHFDERGAGFFALGVARRTETPVALICTSGTAVANLFPAVIEAAMTATPLIAITADRPAHLRGTGANQTIMQPNMFGAYARVSVDLHTGMDIQAIRAALSTSLHHAVTPPPGAVHLNCQFDEPLVGEEKLETFSKSPETSPMTSAPRDRAVIREALSPLEQIKNANLTGITLLGALAPSEQQMAAAMARWLGFPVVADIQSGLRDTRLGPLLYPYPSCGDSLLKQFPAADVLVHLGGEVTSRRTLDWLAQGRFGRILQYRNRPSAWNPLNRQVSHIRLPLSMLAPSDLPPALAASAASFGFGARAQKISAACDRLIPGDQLTEAGATRLLWSLLPAGETVVLASSMPIRCFDQYANAAAPHLVMCNRGASGIDGTIATAAGIAAAEGQRVTLVIGDLAFLHDLNSLALAARAPNLTIVIYNNFGGAIFGHLPLRDQPNFEELFVTPHPHRFRAAAELFGLGYHCPKDLEALAEVIRATGASGESAIIELILDRDRDLALHRQLQRAGDDLTV